MDTCGEPKVNWRETAELRGAEITSLRARVKELGDKLIYVEDIYSEATLDHDRTKAKLAAAEKVVEARELGAKETDWSPEPSTPMPLPSEWKESEAGPRKE